MAKSKMIKVDRTDTQKAVAALYLRVSTDRQAEEGYSIEIQKERLRAYAKSLGYEDGNVELYIDDGFSGGSLDRPGVQRLIEDVKERAVTQVIVYKLDRLSRSQKDTLYLIEDIFLPHNVDFISVQESFNTSTPFGRAVIGILSVFAQLERENIYERTRSGMQKRVEQGYWPGGGRVPFGYDYDAQQGILVPNKDAERVRAIYDLYIKGYSLQKIADMLELKYERLAYQIITRKSNTGCIVYNGVEYKGRHEPIVDVETYERAMAIMMDRSAKRFVSATDHLLTGLVYCGKCGSKMRYQNWGKSGYKFICYSQQSSKQYLVKDPNCDNDRPWADDIENLVVSDLFKMTADNFRTEDEKAEPMNVLTVLQNHYDEISKKIKRLYTLFADDGDETLIETINDLKHSRQSIMEKIKLEEERNFWTRNIQRTKDELKNLKDIWEYMSVQEKQNAIRSVVDRVVVTDQALHISYKY